MTPQEMTKFAKIVQDGMRPIIQSMVQEAIAEATSDLLPRLISQQFQGHLVDPEIRRAVRRYVSEQIEVSIVVRGVKP